jgi:hypothetical protein
MFLDAKTLSKLVFINGDVSKDSPNDVTLTNIIGNANKHILAAVSL